MESKGAIPGKIALREDLDRVFLSKPKIVEPPQPP
jgi:hypothetical protein